MSFMDYIKGEFREFRKSLVLDKRFGKILLIEIALIAAVVIGVLLWANRMGSLTPLMEQAASQEFGMSIPGMMMQDAQSLVDEVKARMTLYLVSIALYLLLVWPFFKALGYTILLGKRLSKALFWRFIVAEVVWTALLALIFFALQFAFYRTLFLSLPYSALARMTLLFGSVFTFVMLCYFTIAFFIMFTREGKFKQAIVDYLRLPIRRLRRFIVPLVFTLGVFLVLNIIIRLLSALPKDVSFVLTSAIVVVYIVWLKVYYCACIGRLSAGHVAARAHAAGVRPAPNRHVVSEKSKKRSHITHATHR